MLSPKNHLCSLSSTIWTISDLDCFMVCLQSEKSSSWAKEALSQFECKALKSSNEWAAEKIGFGRQVEQKKKIDTMSVQEENHNLDREVSIWWPRSLLLELENQELCQTKKNQTPPLTPTEKNPKKPRESNSRNTTGRVAHMHFSTLQVRTLLPLSFQHLPAKTLMLVYREQQPIATYYCCVCLP